MKRREFLAAAGVAAGTTLAGCLGGATGTLATRVTDPAGDIGDFESFVVTLSEIRVLEGEAETNTATDDTRTAKSAVGTADGEQSYEVADAEIDLVGLQDADAVSIDERELETGDYQYLKLVVSNIDATLEGGEDAEVRTLDDAPLNFDTPFEIREGTRTVFTVDFAPVKREDKESYTLEPFADGTEVSYEE